MMLRKVTSWIKNKLFENHLKKKKIVYVFIYFTSEFIQGRLKTKNWTLLPSYGGLLHFWLTGGETKPINLWGVVIKTIDIAGSLEPLTPSLNACLVSWGEMKGRHCKWGDKRCRRRSLHSDVNGFPDAPFTPSVLSVWRLHPQYYIPSRLKQRSLKTLLDPVLRLKLRGSVLLRTGENGGRQKRSRLASWLALIRRYWVFCTV